MLSTLHGQSLETIIQQGHELAVVSVAVSPDSSFLVTGSRDKSAKLWSYSSGREVRSFLGHEATVRTAAFTPDGKLLLTGSNDNSIRLWNIADGSVRLQLTMPEIVTSVAVDPKSRFFAAGGNSDSVLVFDASGNTIKKLPASPDKGMGSGVDITISPDGNFLSVSEDNRIINIYRTTDWVLAKTLSLTEGFCGGCGTRAVFSNDGRWLYAASNHSPLIKYSLPTFEIAGTISNKSEAITGLAISSNGKHLARATEKTVTIWDLVKGDSVEISAEGKGELHQVTFNGDGSELLIACDNNTAMRWNVASKQFGNPFTGLLNQRDRGGLDYDPNFYWQSAIARFIRFKNNIILSRDGKSLIKGKLGTRVKQWDIASGKVEMEYVGHEKAALCYELSADGSRLLTGGGDGKIIVWDTRSGEALTTITAYREPVFDVHFNTDESKVISSSWDGTLRIHDISTQKGLTYVEFEKGSAYNILMSKGDLYFVTARLDNSLQMWEVDTKKEVRNFIGHSDIVSAIAFTKDQKNLLSASWDGTLRMWDVGTGLMTKKFKASSSAIHTAILSADEKNIFAAGADRLIRVWDIATNKVVREFRGHKAEITSIVLSADNKMLISHSLDGVTKFWDLNTGKEFFEHILIGEHDWMAKSPEGYFSGTDEARHFVHFVSGTKTFAVDQFFNEYFRPDLLPKLFQSRGGSSQDKSIQGKLKTSAPPTVKVAIVPLSPGKAEVFVRVTDNGSGAGNLKLFHNGKNVALNHEQLSMPKARGEATTYKQVIDLIGGNNVFSAQATNRDNIESDPQTVSYFSEHATKSSTCYILSVGINQYRNTKLSLNYAKSDAQSFSELMKGRSGQLFRNVELISLFDTEATRSRILATLEDLAGRVSAEDVFIFYYAGHGSMVDNRFYFIPTETSRLYDERALSKEAIEAILLQDKFRQIKALKQLIIMDACQSGGSVELLATRGAGEEKAIAQLSRSAGIHVMASAGSEQFASEFASLGHGLFTSVLIRALEGEADGAPKDGKVTIYELKSFIDDQVPEASRKLKGNPQYPYTFSRGQDFPLVLNK
ncbi:caspase family protein [Chryseolinea sp. T2]|uniref:caspase family protein n=1 Tax=Chryseolinea sp. T2 TaxID=3129255 RepID=UPI003076C640